MLTILLDGVAYGMLLFVLACGLSVTLGLMNFINLAHGAFAMLGGYVTALADEPRRRSLPRHAAGRVRRSGAPRGRARAHALPPALWREPARSGAVHDRPCADGDADRQLFSRRPTATDSSAGLARGRFEFHGVGIGVYQAVPDRASAARSPRLCSSSWSARASARGCAPPSTTRASPPGLGINVDRLFAITFAVGSGLAGLGGALAADVVGGIDPSFPLKFMVTFLIVVTIGGSNGILGALVGALLLGVLDVAGKYYVPSIGAFIIYFVMVVTLILRPQGLFAKGDGR